VTVFSAGIGAAGKSAALARRYIEFVSSAGAIPAIRKSALDPVHAQ
jgi:hypothetical protein